MTTAIQKDLDRLEMCACATVMKFNKAKWKVLHVGQSNPKHKDSLGGDWIESSPERRRTWSYWLMRRSI